MLAALGAKLARLAEGGDPLAGQPVGETQDKQEEADDEAPAPASPVDLKRG